MFFVKWKRGCKLILNSSEATNSWAFYLNKLLSRTSQLRYNQQILSINFNQSIYIRSCYPDIRQETVICYLLDDIENAAIDLEEMRIISKSIEKKAASRSTLLTRPTFTALLAWFCPIVFQGKSKICLSTPTAAIVLVRATIMVKPDNDHLMCLRLIGNSRCA